MKLFWTYLSQIFFFKETYPTDTAEVTRIRMTGVKSPVVTDLSRDSSNAKHSTTGMSVVEDDH